MWETTFEEYMLSDPKGVAIYCPDDDLAKELFEIFRGNGLGENWRAGERGGRVYCVSKKNLQYGAKSAVETVHPYCNYTKCTFYGAVADPMQDVEVGEEEFLAMLNAWGG